MDANSVDKYYNRISEALTALVQSARLDSDGNLQNKNVLMEGFYLDFLNILFGWKLINANAEKQNAKGIDLIDRKNRIAIQISGTCDHEKIQNSLDCLRSMEEGTWHFLFIPVMIKAPKPRDFIIPAQVVFDCKCHIWDTARLLRFVQYAGRKEQFAIAELVALEEAAFWTRLKVLLCDTRDAHPSFVLMRPDEIDKRLFPNIKETTIQRNAYGKTDAGGDACPVWDIIRASWREPENHSIVIEGDGGIGKTVTLFSIADAQEQYCPAPAVYVPMHALVTQEGKCLDLSEYHAKGMDQKDIERINELAKKPWDGGPQLLVLLDGFNEVPAAKQRVLLKKLNDWHLGHKGAQFIAVSRSVDMVKLALDLDRDFKAKPTAITLEPMTEADARDYLTERDITPPEGANIWKALVYPLFLTLYIKTNGLMDRAPAGYALAPKPPKSGGALTWNYLQRELLREETEDWVMRCAVACEYIIPAIAHRMVLENRFTISNIDAKAHINAAVKALNPSVLPHHLSDLFETYREWHDLDDPDFSEVEWYMTVVKETGVLVPSGEKGTFAFMHQHFRDALAGLYLVNQAEMMQDDDPLPEVWHRAANHDVMDYTAELMEEEEAARLWEANRRMHPTDTTATYAMLELQRRRFNGTDSNLNFSGMDLSGMSLVRYMREGRQGEKDMKLFRKPEYSVNTQLFEGTFRSFGHNGSVTCIAVLGDGLCISGSVDGTLQVWDPHTGECLRVMEGPAGDVRCVAATGDGLCVSGSWNGILQVWDLNTGERLHTMEKNTEDINGIPVTKDSISDLISYTLECPDKVNCVTVTRDGLCISGSEDKGLCVWDIRTGECLCIMEGHTGSVTCVTVTEDDLCVSGSWDNTLRVWNPCTGECLRVMEGHTDKVNCVAATREGLCVSGSSDGTLRVWDTRSGKCLRVMEGHTSGVTCIATTKDGLCVSGSYDNILRVWDTRTGECIRAMEGHTGWIDCVAVTEDGLCVSGSNDTMTLQVWDMRTGECLRAMERYSYSVGGVNCVATTEDGLCVSGLSGGTLRVWDTNTDKCLHVMDGHDGLVGCVAVTVDGLCVSGSVDKTLRVWDMYTGESLRVMKECTGRVTCVAMTEDSLCVSQSDDERTLRVWNPCAGEYLRVIEGHTHAFTCVTATGNGLCVSGSWDGTLQVWNPRTGECLRIMEGHTSDVTCIAATGDGLCVSGSSDKTLRVWDTRTGECLRVMEGHTDHVYSVAATRDGLCVVSWSGDKTLRVWDAHTGECLRIMEEHTGSVNCVAVTENGLCISGLWDGTLRVWNMNTGECKDIWYPMEIEVSEMDFSKANLATPVLSKMLRQNRAQTPEAD